MKTGRVKRVLFPRGADPYGFIIPDDGGKNVYFKLKGRGRAFTAQESGYAFTAQVVEYEVRVGDRVMYEEKECVKGPQVECWAPLPKTATGTDPKAGGSGFPTM